MDLQTSLVILLRTFGSAKLIEGLLGPTAEYLGRGLRLYRRRGWPIYLESLNTQPKHSEVDSKRMGKSHLEC
jgi:hypothetical protein